jgi:hypothetical protein
VAKETQKELGKKLVEAGINSRNLLALVASSSYSMLMSDLGQEQSKGHIWRRSSP